MSRVSFVVFALFSCVALMAGCQGEDEANDKIEQCIEDSFGEDAVTDMSQDWSIDCEEGEDACDACIDCVLDHECDEIFDGACTEDCDETSAETSDDTSEESSE